MKNYIKGRDIMDNFLVRCLNRFSGLDINFYINGITGGYCCLENFTWTVNESKDKELLVLETEQSDKHFYINLDYIDLYEYDELTNELIFITSEGQMVQLWTDI